MKNGASLLVLVLLVCVVILFAGGRYLRQDVLGLKDRILAEESARTQEDDRVRRYLEETLDNVLIQLDSLDKEIKKTADRQDLETQLPEEYIRKVRAYVVDRIDALVNQPPVFGTAWEILSIRFLSPDLVSVQCRDGQIHATLLVLIYNGDKGGYAGEVLYSDVQPWAG